MNSRKRLNAKLAELQQADVAQDAPQYWRCLEELADTAAFQELMRQEFPALADVWPDSLNRRRFLSLMGASLALAGIGGCSVRPAPQGTIVPYVHQPEAIVPGRPLFFATTMVHGGDAVGLLVESHEGRPTKVEGNPDHPASLGATNIFHQASVLTLYDPARAQAVVYHDQIRGWDDADAAIDRVLRDQAQKQGAGLRLLTEGVVSPTLGDQIGQFLQRYPQAKWHQYEPISNANSAQAARTAFGEVLRPKYDFSKADVVLSLDADFLAEGPGHLRYARQFMDRRRIRTKADDADSAAMNRLYVVETAVSCTGAKADHRLAVRMSDVEQVARAVAVEVGLPGAQGQEQASRHAEWVKAVAGDLRSHAGRSLVIAGDRQPPAVHLLAHAINQNLNNTGQTVEYTPPAEVNPVDPVESLSELVEDMQQGRVEALFILGVNPVYTAPADLRFASHLEKISDTFHLSLYEDETSRACAWRLPESHYLETWGDARAFDGTASVVQPLISPLYESRSNLEVMARLLGEYDLEGPRIVRAYWQRQWQQQGGGGDFEEFWDTALHDGVIPATSFSPVSRELNEAWQDSLESGEKPIASSELELAFAPSPALYDGRYAQNGWLQEVPQPITKLTWDNAALVSPTTAKKLGLEYQAFAHGGEHGGYEVPLVRLQLEDRSLETPVWIMPGHADDAVTIYLGYGRTAAARVKGEWQSTLGANAYPLRTTKQLWHAPGLQVERLDGTYPLACTQAHQTMDGREVVRSTTLAEYREHPRQAVEQREEKHANGLERTNLPVTMYEPFDYEPPKNKWGMSIDITTCIGCNACVVACQAENNIPVVGKEQVLFGREMHWLRVDRYLHGSLAEPEEFYFQPVPCMHCEHAPCEYVCPVEATVHSAEGLNDMIYNRCVGTRFCSNNCPYKVRRFNFLEYAQFDDAEPQSLQYNPDVTVRSRGVMEKCTYCVQRIRQAEIDAQSADRPLQDGEVLTACQAACPTRAIVFGDLNDPESAVKQQKDTPLDYSLLAELNTLPRTTYLAAVRNPNPELQPEPKLQ